MNRFQWFRKQRNGSLDFQEAHGAKVWSVCFKKPGCMHDPPHTENFLSESVHAVFEEQVRATPDCVALHCEDGSLTYAELNMRSNQLASLLSHHGVRRKSIVAITLDSRLETVVAMMAVLKARAAFTILESDLDAQRAADAFTRSPVALIVERSSRTLGSLDRSVPVFCLDQLQKQLAASSPCDLRTDSVSDDLACVVWTSGSTGVSKGVMRTHRGILTSLLWARLDPNDRYCHLLPFGTGFAIQRLFLPLMSGSTLVVVQQGMMKDVRQLADVLEKQAITTFALVPSLLRQLLMGGIVGNHSLGKIRSVTVAGDRLSPRLAASFKKLLPKADLYVQYGSSESGPITFGKVDDTDRSGLPIGRPVPGVELYVVDPCLKLVPPGIPGELYVGGSYLARGYLDQEELTATHFVSSPMFDGNMRRLYRTGDLVRWLGDGQLEYLGRLGRQVKVRGHRVELGEVEAAIAEVPDVDDVRVEVLSSDEENRLIAYVTMRNRVTMARLLSDLRKRLQAPMVPSQVICLDKLSEATDLALGVNPLPRPDLGTPYSPPKNPVEEAIVAIWCDALHIERIGTDDHFLDLGGDSLLAMQVLIQTEQYFGVSISIVNLFEHPTVSRLSMLIHQRLDAPSTSRDA